MRSVADSFSHALFLLFFLVPPLTLFIVSGWTAAGPAGIRSAARCEDDSASLIAAFEDLHRGAVKEKIALLDRIAACSSDEAVRFVSRVMDGSGEDAVRAHAFRLWAGRHGKETIREYLESRKKSAKIRAFFPVIPVIEGFDGFAFLKELYEDSSLARYERDLFAAMARIDSDDAFAFLKENWEALKDPAKAYDHFPLLMAMKGSWSPGFLDGLLGSKLAFARCAAAKRFLGMSPGASLARVEVFLGTEADRRVRSRVVAALAAVKSSGAAGVLIRTAKWHAADRLFEIVDALAAMPREVVEKAFPKEWWRRSDTRAFRILALVVSRWGEREWATRLKAAAKSPSAASRIVAAVARGRIVRNTERIRRLMGSPKIDESFEILETIARFRLRDEAVVKKLLALASSSKAGEARIEAARVLGRLGAAAALPVLEKCLAAPNLLVRVAAAKALSGIPGKGSVRLLIGRLGSEKISRAAWEIARSLKILTGVDLGRDGGRWKAWWEKEGEGVVLPGPPSEEGRALWVPGGPAGGRYSFYGLPIDSHNLVFVIDVSGSMAGPRILNRGEEAPISRLRRELARTIKGLTPDHRMNMIFFSDRVRKWRESLVPMSRAGGGYKEEALAYVRYLSAQGGTNLYGALMAAMEDDEADTVVLLSDGDPTVGKITDPDAILEAVLKRNRKLQIAFHVIGLGDANRSFLKRLALSTGGTFKML